MLLGRMQTGCFCAPNGFCLQLFFISPLNVLYFLVNLLLVPNSCLLPLGEIEWKKWTIILQKSGGIIDTIVGRYGSPRYHYAAFL